MFERIKKGLSEFTDWYARRGFRKLSELRGEGGSSWSGENVSEATALNHSVVWACKRRISEAVGFLPLELKQHTSSGKFPVPDHPMYFGLKNAPNDEMSAMSFRESLTGHALMHGNAYAQIVRRHGTGEAHELWPLLPGNVEQDREKTGQKRLVYVVKNGSSADKTFTVARGKPHDILHVSGMSFDGTRGYSVLEVARHSFGTGLATERNVGSFHARGGRVPYILLMKQKFKTDEDFKKFQANWEQTYSNPHKAPILENDMTYEQTGLSMADAQMLESRQFSIPEICRWFLMQPHMVGDLSRATFSNIEHLAIEFVTLTLMPWLKRWEDNLARCVLTPEEKSKGYFFKHNQNALLRGDFPTRMAGYATALQNGHMSINEVRDLEDRNAIEGGDDHHIQLNMQSLPGETPTASQAAALVKIGASKGVRNGN